MIDLLKSLLNIDVADNSKDVILNMYLDLSKNGIVEYINKSVWSDEDTLKYNNQITLYAKYLYENRNNMNISSKTQGARATSYNNSNTGLPKEIKALLPMPYARVM